MKFLIKIFMSCILVCQMSYSKTEVLLYQQDGFKRWIEYMKTQPTLDDAAKTLALLKMEPKILKFMRQMFKEQQLSKNSRTAAIDLNGNKLTIEGLAHPIVFSNSSKVEISYNGEAIFLKNPADIGQSIRDLENFFNSKSVQIDRVNKELYSRLFFGENAFAGALMIAIIIGMTLAGVVGWSHYSKKAAENSKLLEWVFSNDNFGKSFEIKCENNNLTYTCGDEKMSFASGTDPLKGSVYKVIYTNTKTKENGTLLFDEITGGVASVKGRFADAHYTPARKGALSEAARNILGSSGNRRLCKGNEFVDKETGSIFKELAAHYSQLSANKDYTLPKKMKDVDSEGGGTK